MCSGSKDLEGVEDLRGIEHISGLGANLHKLSSEQRAAVRSLELALKVDPAAQANADYIDDSVLVRFLIARDWNHDRALKMLHSALEWRMKRPSHRWLLAAPSKECGLPAAVPPDTEHARTLREGATTGKVRVTGTDRWGRAVMVFDNTVENSACSTEMVEYLAYNMELCRRTALLAGKGADKLVIFLHMTHFSIFNQPPIAVIKEVLKIVSVAFPESLGVAVLHNPPKYFTTLWNLVKHLVDPKTKNKIIHIHGSIEDGSDNDQFLRRVIGPDWKVLTGAGMEVVAQGFSKKHNKLIDASVGFDLEAYWPTVLQREEAFATHLARAKAAAITAGGVTSKAHQIEGIEASTAFSHAVATAQPVLGYPASKAQVAVRATERSLAVDVATVAPSVPAWLWLLDQEAFWRAVRAAPCLLRSTGGGLGSAATWAGSLAELIVVLVLMVASVFGTETAFTRRSPAWSGAQVFRHLVGFAASCAAAFLFMEKISGGLQAELTVSAASVVAIAREWSTYFVGVNSFLLLVRRR